MKKSCGQQATEFMLLISLISISGLMILTLLGENISNIFDNITTPIRSISFAKKQHVPVDVIDKSNQDLALLSKKEVLSTDPIANNMVPITINGFTIPNVPQDGNDFLQATGASGYSENLADMLDSVIAQLIGMNVNEPGMDEIIALAKALAKEGHVLADSEEWLEIAAKRLETSDEPVTIPDDNAFCGDGNLEGMTTNCIKTIALQDQFYNDPTYIDLISTRTDKFQTFLSKTENKYTGSDQRVLNAIKLISTLGNEILNVSGSLQNSYSQAKTNTNINLDNLKQMVSSQTTDLYSILISQEDS